MVVFMVSIVPKKWHQRNQQSFDLVPQQLGDARVMGAGLHRCGLTSRNSTKAGHCHRRALIALAISS
jgi:hypothetical protein